MLESTTLPSLLANESEQLILEPHESQLMRYRITQTICDVRRLAFLHGLNQRIEKNRNCSPALDLIEDVGLPIKTKAKYNEEIVMRLLAPALVFVTLSSQAFSDPVFSTSTPVFQRVADGSPAACLASCASQNDSCKRACPATFSTPCLTSCDSQAQTCQQSCQRK
jgi:hypothetical protein